MPLGLPCSARWPSPGWRAPDSLSPRARRSRRRPRRLRSRPPSCRRSSSHVAQKAYVFAKVMLEQEGFAWRVEGSVRGYRDVAAQTPAPGSKLVASFGAPTIVLRLQRNAGYAQEGTPENTLPHACRPAGWSPPTTSTLHLQEGGAGGASGQGDEDDCRGEGCGEAAELAEKPVFDASGRSWSPARPPSPSTRRRSQSAREARRLGLRAPKPPLRPLTTGLYQLDRFGSGVRLVARAEALTTRSCPSTSACSPSGSGGDSEAPSRAPRSRRTSGRSHGDVRGAVAHAPGGRKRLHPARVAHVDGDPAPDDHGRLHRPAAFHLEGRARHEQPLCGQNRGAGRILRLRREVHCAISGVVASGVTATPQRATLSNPRFCLSYG